MSIYVESKYLGSQTGLYAELTECESIDEVVATVREAMRRPGWSDSVLVDTQALPGPAVEVWQQRTAAQASGP